MNRLHDSHDVETKHDGKFTPSPVHASELTQFNRIVDLQSWRRAFIQIR